MTLSQEDITIISTILSTQLSSYDRKLRNVEKLLKKMNSKRIVDDSWMSYDELSKNIVELCGDEYNRDFNIIRVQQ